MGMGQGMERLGRLRCRWSWIEGIGYCWSLAPRFSPYLLTLEVLLGWVFNGVMIDVWY